MDKSMESEVLVLVQRALKEELAPLERRQEENHKQNRRDIHDLRGKMETIANEFHLFIAELRGADKEKKAAAERRDEIMNRTMAEAAKGTKWATWGTVVAAIAAALIGALVAYVIANRDHNAKLIGSDPSVADYYNNQ